MWKRTGQIRWYGLILYDCAIIGKEPVRLEVWKRIGQTISCELKGSYERTSLTRLYELKCVCEKESARPGHKDLTGNANP